MNCIKIGITYCFGRAGINLPCLSVLSKICLLSYTLKQENFTPGTVSGCFHLFFPLNVMVCFINLWTVDDQAIFNVGRNFY